MTESGAAVRRRPPPPTAAPPPITDHEFEPYPFAWPTCSRVEIIDKVGRPCDRPEHEHTLGGDQDALGMGDPQQP